jgi:hypothetical protein
MSKGKEYLLLVESARKEGKVTQKTICNFGLLKNAISSGVIDRFVASGAKFSEKLVALSELNSDSAICINKKIIGPSLIFSRLWSDLHLDKIITRYSKGTKITFPIERVIFMTVVNWLVEPGSDRACLNWLIDNEIPGSSQIELHHFCRTMSWLGTPVEKIGLTELPVDNDVEVPNQNEPERDRDQINDGLGFSPEQEPIYEQEFEPDTEIYISNDENSSKKTEVTQPKMAVGVRSVKDVLEEAIFAARSNILTQLQLQLVFFDTISIYFEGNGGDELGKRAHNSDHHQDINQVVVGMVIDQTGYPVCTEVWPGNTADVTTLLPVAERLKSHFNIEKVCVVGDSGIISENTIKSLLEMNWSYILVDKMSNVPDMKEIFADDSLYSENSPPRQKSTDRALLVVKEVYVSRDRYIVCFNEAEAQKDRHTREEIVNKLSQALKSGDNILIVNKEYEHYLGNSNNNFIIDADKIIEEEKYDGIFVLKTNLNIPAPEIALQYNQLLTVETMFRTIKSILEKKPIYNLKEETIRGHIWCGYLALLLKKSLMDAVENNKESDEPTLEWENIIRDLKMLDCTETEVNGKIFKLRPSAKPAAVRAFRALGIALPKLIELLGTSDR